MQTKVQFVTLCLLKMCGIRTNIICFDCTGRYINQEYTLTNRYMPTHLNKSQSQKHILLVQLMHTIINNYNTCSDMFRFT
jgi:hypothetical protein